MKLSRWKVAAALAAIALLCALSYAKGYVDGAAEMTLAGDMTATRNAATTEVGRLRIFAVRGPEVAFESTQVILAAAIETLELYVAEPAIGGGMVVAICGEDLQRFREVRDAAPPPGLSGRLKASIAKLEGTCGSRPRAAARPA